jgi:hypothetical protein
MTNRQLTEAQIDRYDAFEAMLDMMDPTATYSRDEIKVTIEQIVEMAVEDREAEKPETYLDRYSDQRVQEFSNQELLQEADRLENKGETGPDDLDTIDGIRYSFVKTELRYRANTGIL